MYKRSADKNRLGWYRWEVADPQQPNYWTATTVSVYEPTYERPYISILVSIANGGGRVLYRAASLEDAQLRTGMDYTGFKKLEVAVIKAKGKLLEVQADLKLIYESKKSRVESEIDQIMDDT
jgi:hypothetical protein